MDQKQPLYLLVIVQANLSGTVALNLNFSYKLQSSISMDYQRSSTLVNAAESTTS